MLERLRLREEVGPFIIVLGHPDFYPRFGFGPASRFGIKSQWEGMPDHAFMILWLDASMMNQITGMAKYRSEFNAAYKQISNIRSCIRYSPIIPPISRLHILLFHDKFSTKDI